jgi:hypothetical protein
VHLNFIHPPVFGLGLWKKNKNSDFKRRKKIYKDHLRAKPHRQSTQEAE